DYYCQVYDISAYIF
nr:immunoglobulin light chain junction region [Macaca mulatta]MOV95586.1 immunoglobulin light chain junction region [Macaca mulatta]MOV96154.1 immunoglobulin light chain junction region [Macaca mulatta]MOV97535.1 immunoglobulin light chain junction region [Macaca mulatta]MOV98096.1 immunoglobulin light chain junction region [Macaca mulatta]